MNWDMGYQQRSALRRSDMEESPVRRSGTVAQRECCRRPHSVRGVTVCVHGQAAQLNYGQSVQLPYVQHLK